MGFDITFESDKLHALPKNCVKTREFDKYEGERQGERRHR